MNRKSTRTVLVGSIVLASAIALSGCTINLGSGAYDGMGMNHGNGMMNQGQAQNGLNNSGFSGADIMFAQMMIPHHEQAVLMSTLAETHTSNPTLLALAKQIKDAQAPEILQMKSWLKAAGASLEMNHSMGMGGMLTATDIAALSAAKDATFDKLYLIGMIGHHEGAVHMAQMVIDSANSEARALGKAIVTSQTAEIAYMKTLLSAK